MKFFYKIKPGRVRRLFLTLSLFAVVATASAQNESIIFPRSYMSIEDIMKTIQEQTRFVFAFEVRTFDTGKVLSLRPQNLSLQEVLDKISESTGCTYSFQKRFIVINPETAAPSGQIPASRVEIEQPEPIQSYEPNVNPDDSISAKAVEADLYPGQSEDIIPIQLAPVVAEESIELPGNNFKSKFPGGISNLPVVGIKSNLLYWGATTPNLGFEFGLGPKTTLNITGGYNPWRFGKKENNKKLKHWLASAEVRMWTSEKFEGHFFGVHGFYGRYNSGGVKLPMGLISGLKDNRYQGYGIGAGFSYGYQWYLGPHWNLEANIGVGYAYLNYKRSECYKCGGFIEKTHKNYIGPTKLGLSFIYLIKPKETRSLSF